MYTHQNTIFDKIDSTDVSNASIWAMWLGKEQVEPRDVFAVVEEEKLPGELTSDVILEWATSKVDMEISRYELEDLEDLEDMVDSMDPTGGYGLQSHV